MKHLPNLLTLANLFCGCIAIAYILNAQPFLTDEQHWVVCTTPEAYWGSIFIGVAAIFDMLDGSVARLLKVHSPIGKDLDSLADLVSFGVAPAMILFQMLWGAWMNQHNALDVSMVAMAPAFLVACFAAIRLAKYNISADGQRGSFRGMPVPAVGIFVASLPLINWYDPYHISAMIQGKWTIYIIIAVLCWLMVSGIRFIKLMPAKWNIAHTWPQLIIVIAAVAAFPFIKFAAIPVAFILYIILSIVYKYPNPESK